MAFLGHQHGKSIYWIAKACQRPGGTVGNGTMVALTAKDRAQLTHFMITDCP